MSLADAAYNFVSTIFTAIPGNTWWTENLDATIGQATYLFCFLVLAMAVWVGVAVLRWFGSLFDWRR